MKLGLGLRSSRRGGSFSPASLFSGGVGGAFYQPSDLSTLYSDIAGTTAAVVNGPVGKMLDKSGNGNHLTSPVDACRPILRQSGALYYLEFDGTDDGMRAAFAMTQPMDRISSVRQISWTSPDNIFSDYDNGVVLALGQDGTSPAIYMQSTFGSNINTSDLAVGSDGVISERWDGASSSLQIDLLTALTGSGGSASAGGLLLACRNADVSNCYATANIRFYGAFQRSGTLSAAEKLQVQNYMAALQGRTL